MVMPCVVSVMVVTASQTPVGTYLFQPEKVSIASLSRPAKQEGYLERRCDGHQRCG